jgi:hypothetical protein
MPSPPLTNGSAPNTAARASLSSNIGQKCAATGRTLRATRQPAMVAAAAIGKRLALAWAADARLGATSKPLHLSQRRCRQRLIRISRWRPCWRFYDPMAHARAPARTCAEIVRTCDVRNAHWRWCAVHQSTELGRYLTGEGSQPSCGDWIGSTRQRKRGATLPRPSPMLVG